MEQGPTPDTSPRDDSVDEADRRKRQSDVADENFRRSQAHNPDNNYLVVPKSTKRDSPETIEPNPDYL